MNLKSLVVVILRLLALNFLLQSSITLAPQLLRFADMYQRAPNQATSLLGFSWFFMVGMVGAAILLWTFSLPIAGLVTRDLPPELSLGSLSLADCYSIAFMGVGLAYIVSHFSGVLTWSHYLLKMAASRQDESWREKVNWYDALQVFVPFILGSILFINGRKWAIALARRQPETAPPAGPPSAEQGSAMP